MDKAQYYIFCPAHLVTGGPEALHQLRYYMDKTGLDAYLVYFCIKENTNPIPSRYLIYEPKIKKIDEINDIKTNYIIVPESSSIILNDYKNAIKCIWWLSVKFYDNTPKDIIWKTKDLIRVYILGQKSKNPFNFSIKDCINLCGSKYAFDFLKKKRIKNRRYLVEPISKQFLDSKITESYERNNVILYNPSKPSETTTKLLACSEFSFKPLKNMDINQLIETYLHAKLYIDFGDFGGPERIPKETIFFGCNILVGYKNAAKNNFDVAIPKTYKIKETNNLEAIKLLIKNNLKNYDTNFHDFDQFRLKIQKLEENFIKQIQEIFILKNSKQN